jgi:hypothetical protein
VGEVGGFLSLILRMSVLLRYKRYKGSLCGLKNPGEKGTNEITVALVL